MKSGSLFRQVKIRTKLFVSFLSVSLIPILILGVLYYYFVSQSLHTQVENRVDDYLISMSNQVDRSYERVQEAIDRFLYQDNLLALLTAVQSKRMDVSHLYTYEEDVCRQLQTGIPSVKQVDVLMNFSEEGRAQSSALSDRINRALRTDESNAALLKKGGSFWFFDEKEMYIVRTVWDLYQNRQAATLVVTLDNRLYFEDLFDEQLSDFGLVITDNTGAAVNWLSKGLMPTGIIPLTTLEKSPSDLVRYNGARYLYNSTTLEAKNWTLYAIVSYADIDRRSADIIQILLWTLGISTILVIVLANIVSRNFSRRLEAIIGQMKQVSAGDWLVSTDDTEKDEIGQLGRAFDHMIRSMEALIDDMYEGQIAQRKLEYKALVAQISPHFLYNCFDNLNWYAIMRGDKNSSYLITQLSDFYRTSLNKGRSFTTVEGELCNASAYMNLQKELHDNCFVFEKEIEEDIGRFVTVNLMLQPLLENAIKHGVDKNRRDKSAMHRICLSASREGELLVFTVFNTGEPISAEAVEAVMQEKTQGYGLRNVNERIKLAFGEEYGVTITPCEDGPMCVVRIPQQLKREGEDDE